MSMQRIAGLLDVHAPIEAVQCATGGVWQAALRFERGAAASPDYAAVREQAADASAAVELFVAGGAFLGLRFDTLSASRRPDLLESIVRAALARWPDLAAAITGIDDLLDTTRPTTGSPEQRLLTGPPSWAELGIVNDWDARAEATVWHAGGGYSEEEVRKRIARLRPRGRPLALELAWTRPCHHWLGLPLRAAADRAAVEECTRMIAIARKV